MKLTTNEAFILLKERVLSHHSNKPFIIAIDGRSTSGKTTFSYDLEKKLNVPVIHTDDFCRPRNKFGELEITDYDGNFDLTRFKNEAIDGMLSCDSFNIGIFNCECQCVSTVKQIPFSKCYVVEGAYSLNPKLGEYADIKLFFDIDPNRQRQRIITRNGVRAFESFNSFWIPAEERYFSHYDIISLCDIVVTQ